MDTVKGPAASALSPDAIVTLVFKVCSCTRKISPLPAEASPLEPFSPWKNAIAPAPDASCVEVIVPFAISAAAIVVFAISADVTVPSVIERETIFLIAMS